MDRAVDTVLADCVDLDPTAPPGTPRRSSDGRSVWLDPTAPHVTTEAVLAQEERILTWALDAQAAEPAPAPNVDPTGLDVLQHAAASAVAGDDPLVLIVGPAGTGKTTMLRAAVTHLHSWPHWPVVGFAPTAKAAHVLRTETGMATDTVAKLLHEWSRPDRPPDNYYRLEPGIKVIIDEAGMLATADLCRLIDLADQQQWRLVLVGDPHQLQAVGRGGMFAELCATGRTIELDRIHRFTQPWEAAASLRLRHGDPRALDAYEAHGRISAGLLEQHIPAIADRWIHHHDRGETVAITTTRNDDVDRINWVIRARRYHRGDIDLDTRVPTADGNGACVGDIITTRRNDRTLITTAGDHVRNRDHWTVTAITDTGDLDVTRIDGHSTVTLPAELRRRPRPARLRRHRTRQPVRHPRPQPHPRHRSHHQPRPLRRHDPRTTHQPRLRRHRHHRPHRSPRRPRTHPPPRPHRHPRHRTPPPAAAGAAPEPRPRT